MFCLPLLTSDCGLDPLESGLPCILRFWTSQFKSIGRTINCSKHIVKEKRQSFLNAPRQKSNQPEEKYYNFNKILSSTENI